MLSWGVGDSEEDWEASGPLWLQLSEARFLLVVVPSVCPSSCSVQATSWGRCGLVAEWGPLTLSGERFGLNTPSARTPGF